MINGKHGQGTPCTKMGADKLAENTPNDPKFICLNCLPRPKVWDFDEKRLHWAPVVRGLWQNGFVRNACLSDKSLENGKRSEIGFILMKKSNRKLKYKEMKTDYWSVL